MTLELLLAALKFYEQSPDGQYDEVAASVIKDRIINLINKERDHVLNGKNKEESEPCA